MSSTNPGTEHPSQGGGGNTGTTFGQKIKGAANVVHGVGESIRFNAMDALDSATGTSDRHDRDRVEDHDRGRYEAERGVGQMSGHPVGGQNTGVGNEQQFGTSAPAGAGGHGAGYAQDTQLEGNRYRPVPEVPGQAGGGTTAATAGAGGEYGRTNQPQAQQQQHHRDVPGIFGGDRRQETGASGRQADVRGIPSTQHGQGGIGGAPMAAATTVGGHARTNQPSGQEGQFHRDVPGIPSGNNQQAGQHVLGGGTSGAARDYGSQGRQDLPPPTHPRGEGGLTTAAGGGAGYGQTHGAPVQQGQYAGDVAGAPDQSQGIRGSIYGDPHQKQTTDTSGGTGFDHGPHIPGISSAAHEQGQGQGQTTASGGSRVSGPQSQNAPREEGRHIPGVPTQRRGAPES
ncbi:hypothetical protein EVG20_g2201 [Dentipellis fragilis]|uniref:Uncharacterized protein n=1 Tax=Dentipellis fragilis TaxID=205917 RepID=A0A4Y9ZAC4_9AGAM|nr:hypothetical protein EVG20_g2201 [Dentipellis fragilis]